MMEKILGLISSHMIYCNRKQKYFYNGGLLWDENSSHVEFVNTIKSLKHYMLQDDVEQVKVLNLLRKMLEFDPAQCITLAEALLHPFFTGLNSEQQSFNNRHNPSR